MPRSRKPPAAASSARPGSELVDDYLARLPAPMRSLLGELRRTIREEAPDAEETISYRMPAFRWNGILVYYAGFADHASLFPGSVRLLEKYSRSVAPFRTSKGTLQFTPGRPLPKGLVRKLVRGRLSENAARSKVGSRSGRRP